MKELKPYDVVVLNDGVKAVVLEVLDDGKYTVCPIEEIRYYEENEYGRKTNS